MEATELAAAVEAVRQMTGAKGTTMGTVLIAMWLLGYRRVTEAMPIVAAQSSPPTPPVSAIVGDELFQRLGQ